jgi:hypothetical protein
MTSNLRVKFFMLTALCLAPAALAQEATNTPAATQPAEGNLYLRQKLQYMSFGDDPSPEDRDIDKLVATTSLTYGLRRDMSLSLDLPLVYMWEEHDGMDEDGFGVNDPMLTFKYRPVQVDLNPIDSVRLAVYGGLEFPSGDGDFSSHSFDPVAGAVFTAIIGRHGVNQNLSYKFNFGGDEFNTRAGDGPDDAFRYDTAYLFRIAPAEYTPETTAAAYITFELNGLYETGGDNEILIGPGFLYEAKSFAVEATIGVPVVQDVDDRPETDLVVTFGFRVLF